MKILSDRNIKAAMAMVALQLLPNVLAAAMTDIADSPLASAANSNIKPNILFMLDDSASMEYDYMPDSVNSNNTKNCYRNYLYNRLYYNPLITYSPPVKADGTSYPNTNFSAALDNGFDTSSATKNLQNSYYYNANSGVVEGDCAANNKYTKVTLSSSSAEATNFANWYSYYRTRHLLMRTAMGKAFINVSDKYRVGLTTINERIISLDIKDFDQIHKNNFYSNLYSIPSNVYATPLRGAVMKAGKYFAKQLNNQAYDPLEYSCQQNFVILSTDGYWNNDSAGNGGESSNYGPYKLTTSDSVENQDNSGLPRPFLDDYQSQGNDCLGKIEGSGIGNTLADVAMYYYNTDLRDKDLLDKLGNDNCTGALGTKVCTNNVPGAGEDTATHQHITLFTLGLGVDGRLKYADNYKQGGSSDYNAILNGTRPWPDPICKGLSQSKAGPERIDDLWHAAVNGRGTYFSANNPQSLMLSLDKALSAINARNGASAAAATSSLEPIQNDNFVFVALYRTVKWDGDLKAFEIDPVTGKISSTTLWSAQEKLDTQVGSASLGNDGRTIYMYSGTAASKLRLFTYSNLTAEGKNGFFDSMCGASPKLSQCSEPTLNLTATQKGMISGENLVKYLRGQSNYEDQSGNTDRLYRDREHTLGDIISAVPVYLKTPPFKYADFGYGTFVTANKDRAATVFVAANDGMLHAFNAVTGEERWAFVPTAVLEKLYKLADINYGQNHDFFVDGSPTVADICTANCNTASATWKTILIGGLNKGGRAYYVLDVTDPTTPKGLWEFTDDDLGLSFGNPVVTKNKAGTWVILFGSGYNNASPGDGNGHLFVVNATTGALIDKIPTLENSNPVGSTTTPSGLAKINAWIESEVDNTAERAYGGDLLGNLWRFDFDDNYSPAGKEAVKLAELRVGGNPQPITTKPELAKVNSLYDVVFVGTGSYLGVPDLSNVEQQSIYALKDTLASTGLGDVRQGNQLVEQTLTQQTNSVGRVIRTVSQNTVDWATKNGWYLDLDPANLSPGERVNIEMQQQYNILTVATNVPDPNACNVGGYGFLYNIDIATGGGLSTAPEQGTQVGVRLSTNALVAGIKVVKLVTGKTIALVTDTTGTTTPEEIPSPTGAAAGSVKRTMWREIFD